MSHCPSVGSYSATILSPYGHCLRVIPAARGITPQYFRSYYWASQPCFQIAAAWLTSKGPNHLSYQLYCSRTIFLAPTAETETGAGEGATRKGQKSPELETDDDDDEPTQGRRKTYTLSRCVPEPMSQLFALFRIEQATSPRGLPACWRVGPRHISSSGDGGFQQEDFVGCVSAA